MFSILSAQNPNISTCGSVRSLPGHQTQMKTPDKPRSKFGPIIAWLSPGKVCDGFEVPGWMMISNTENNKNMTIVC